MLVNYEFAKHCKLHDYNDVYLNDKTEQMEIAISGRKEIEGMVILLTPVDNLEVLLQKYNSLYFEM